jgi:hypothetical protein
MGLVWGFNAIVRGLALAFWRKRALVTMAGNYFGNDAHRDQCGHFFFIEGQSGKDAVEKICKCLHGARFLIIGQYAAKK